MILIQKMVISYVVGINILAYIIMWYDKLQAKKKGSRVPEVNLFMIAVTLGAVGIYLGMKAPIYHKAAKTSFKIGIPLIIVLNVICIYVCFRLCSN
jgi:uncharacterized membrane protein YsdA (DUF1294 family)